MVLWGPIGAVAQVIINEVMPVPPAGEPEWVELYNPGERALELTNWWLTDLRTAVSLPRFLLPPRGYAVLTRDTAALREARRLPEGTTLVELRLPTLNNTSDAVILRRPDSVLVDSLFYTMRWGRAGVSLERREPTLPAWAPDNLAPCQAPAGATPGEVNSVTPLPADYAVESLAMSSLTAFSVTVLNAGTAPHGEASVTFWIDANRDGQYTEDERRLHLQVPELSPGQRWTKELAAPLLWGELPAGWYSIRAAVELPGDMRRWNDTLQRRFYRSAVSATISINELLYEPLPGGAEFVELVNTGNDTLALEGWKLHTWRPTQTDTLTIATPLKLGPGELAVIAWDSAIVRSYPWLLGHAGVYIGKASLWLRNSGDVVIVRDPNGVTVDSVPYSPRWHDPAARGGRGLSLEKLHPLLPSTEPSSWSSCGAPEGATPGRPNSIAIPVPLQGTVQAAPNPFRIAAAERHYCLIAYELPFQKATVTVRIFTEEGMPLRTLEHARFSASRGFVRWDGRTDRGEFAPPGVYVVVVEALDLNSGRQSVSKMPLVVAY